MTPSMRTVVRTRYWLRFACRLVAILIMVRAMWAAREDLMQVARDPFFDAMGLSSGGPGVWYWLGNVVFTLAAHGVVAALILLADRFALRWVVPNATGGCSKCGYPTPHGAGACPECGQDVKD